MKTPSPQEVIVPSNTVAPIRSGHPWVWADRVRRVPAGEVVTLVDNRGHRLGWGFADDGPIAVRVLGIDEAPPADVARWLRVQLSRADALRTRLIPADTDAFRVVHGEGDGLSGLVVDRYADLAVIRVYSLAWERWLDAVVDAVAGLAWCTSVVRRLGVERVDGAEGLVVLRGPAPPQQIVVTEHGMRLLVRPWVGQKTGMFLDQREHRRMVRETSAGRMVANLFAYHGGFSVAAALGGAAQVTSVDIAPEAIEDARENFRLNGLNPDRYGFEVADAFAWQSRTPLDLLVLDPPSLSHGKATEAAAGRAYRKLHEHYGPQVLRDGLFVTSSCTARLPETHWVEAVEAGLVKNGAWSWLWRSGAPVDHPVAVGHSEGGYLKFGVLRRRA